VADQIGTAWTPKNLVNGLNFYLNRLPSNRTTSDDNESDINAVDRPVSQICWTKRQSLKSADAHFVQSLPQNNNILILSSAVAPATSIPNQNYDPNVPEDEVTNPKNFPWDVRFSATRRTYAYRILHSYDVSISRCGGELEKKQHDTQTIRHSSGCYYSQPFEHDRVWRIHEKHTWQTENIARGLDIDAMNQAGLHFVGTHDYTSFRGKGCQRSSPIVTLEDVWVDQEKYHGNGTVGVLSAVWKRKLKDNEGILPSLHTHKSLHLITVVITGKSFLYHQVRNMVACLVDVGRGKLKPNDVKEILERKDRSCASGMAPAQGLFLVDVEHGEFQF
jgi:tRNA pseudouridine(38-40) synthase